MFYVYVLRSGEHRYIGMTNDIDRRLIEHDSGQSFATKAHAPWELFYFEAHTNEEDAKRREKYLKTTQGRQALKRMLRHALVGSRSSGQLSAHY
jgi:putative endonuclease